MLSYTPFLHTYKYIGIEHQSNPLYHQTLPFFQNLCLEQKYNSCSVKVLTLPVYKDCKQGFLLE